MPERQHLLQFFHYKFDDMTNPTHMIYLSIWRGAFSLAKGRAGVMACTSSLAGKLTFLRPQLPHYMLQSPSPSDASRCFTPTPIYPLPQFLCASLVVPLLYICYLLKQQLRITQKLQRNLEMAIYFCYDVKGKMTIGHWPRTAPPVFTTDLLDMWHSLIQYWIIVNW